MTEKNSTHLTIVHSIEEPQKNPQGAPKNFDWDASGIDDEIHARMKAGTAKDTVEAEAKYLRLWLREKGVVFEREPLGPLDPEKPYGYERVRERLKRRYGGTKGYKMAREHHLWNLDNNISGA